LAVAAPDRGGWDHGHAVVDEVEARASALRFVVGDAFGGDPGTVAVAGTRVDGLGRVDGTTKRAVDDHDAHPEQM